MIIYFWEILVSCFYLLIITIMLRLIFLIAIEQPISAIRSKKQQKGLVDSLTEYTRNSMDRIIEEAMKEATDEIIEEEIKQPKTTKKTQKKSK